MFKLHAMSKIQGALAVGSSALLGDFLLQQSQYLNGNIFLFGRLSSYFYQGIKFGAIPVGGTMYVTPSKCCPVGNVFSKTTGDLLAF